MVLGLRSKSKKSISVQVDYAIHIQEIKPWPPSQSLKSLRNVILQWENGDHSTGSTNPVAPSLDDGKIAFNESFKLEAMFFKDPNTRGHTFQKNLLEFSLYEPRRESRDKSMKGQLLGSAIVDLAEHRMIQETVAVQVPVQCKRSFRNTSQPLIYLKIQPFEMDVGSSSSSRESLSKEMSVEKDGKESVSALMTEEYAEEAEIASFTDDDISPRSSVTISSSAFEANVDIDNVAIQRNPEKEVQKKVTTNAVKKNREKDTGKEKLSLEFAIRTALSGQETIVVRNGASKNPEILHDVVTFSSNGCESGSQVNPERSDNVGMNYSATMITLEGSEEEAARVRSEESLNRNNAFCEMEVEKLASEEDRTTAEDLSKEEIFFHESGNEAGSLSGSSQNDNLDLTEPTGSDHITDGKGKAKHNGIVHAEVANHNHRYKVVTDKRTTESQLKLGPEKQAESHEAQSECLAINPPLIDIQHGEISSVSVSAVRHTPSFQKHIYLQNDLKSPSLSYRVTSSPRFSAESGNRTISSDRLKSSKFSVRSPSDLFGSITSPESNKLSEDLKEIGTQHINKSSKSFRMYDRINEEATSVSSLDRSKLISKDKMDTVSFSKIQELELKIEMLETELQEAAATEIGLYSIVAEHGSSAQKVHTPARRLSRLYFHASRNWSTKKGASAAKSCASGLVLAAKACGNDVPRLMFWLSNSVVLRTIVGQTFGLQNLTTATNGTGLLPKRTSPLKWGPSISKKEFSLTDNLEDWQAPNTFLTSLEKIEAWIFSRIVESVWWQTLTPYMQSVNEDNRGKKGLNLQKLYGRASKLGDEQQAKLSIEIWKNAFKDACERLCPVRAGGHECGCLSSLARLVMEQCIARLDVAMFNAILRESDDEIPSDPISDPISDSKVLPVPSGRSSFGAGAQLKNAIGTWSRCLSDLFGLDADDESQEEIVEDDERVDVAETLKSFHLLNALSDLLMLPKDMLLKSSIRKEVCPTFSASIIKKILDGFEPDEFCPDPIPDEVLEVLGSEEYVESSEGRIKSSPCSASPIVYTPPSVNAVQSIIGEVRSASSLKRSGSSVTRKCHTSDDELDEIGSPLASLEDKISHTTEPRRNNCNSTLRYQLLREVWRDVD